MIFPYFQKYKINVCTRPSLSSIIEKYKVEFFVSSGTSLIKFLMARIFDQSMLRRCQSSNWIEGRNPHDLEKNVRRVQDVVCSMLYYAVRNMRCNKRNILLCQWNTYMYPVTLEYSCNETITKVPWTLCAGNVLPTRPHTNERNELMERVVSCESFST